MNAIGRARNARLNQALNQALAVRDNISALTGATMNDVVDKKDGWADARNALELLTQCFHEANAYNNALAETKRPRTK